MSSQKKHKRTKAQAAASRKWAAAGRASQKKKRAFEKAHGLPTRTSKQQAASKRWAAAGRVAQKRARQGLKPLPTHKRALAGDQAVGNLGTAGTACELSLATCRPVDAIMILAETNKVESCCAATAIATHLYISTGILPSQDEIMGLHLAAGGESGAYIPHLLEVASSSGLAGTRVARFWPVADLNLPGTVAGLRLPSGTHSVLILSRAECVSWGSVGPVSGELEEAWWLEWAESRPAEATDRGSGPGRPVYRLITRPAINALGCGWAESSSSSSSTVRAASTAG